MKDKQATTRGIDYAEPWDAFHDYNGETLIRVVSAGGVAASVLFTENRRERAVACVNACAGINPEAVPDLLAALREADRLVSQVFGSIGWQDALRGETGIQSGNVTEWIGPNLHAIQDAARAAIARATEAS